MNNLYTILKIPSAFSEEFSEGITQYFYDVTGPGLSEPRHYPTESIALEAVQLFTSIYKQGFSDGAK